MQANSDRSTSGTWRVVRYLSVVLLSVALVVFGLPGSAANADSTASPTITSDQVDYAPGSTVTLTGAGWSPAESVHVTVDDNVGQSWHFADDVTADDSGAFTEQLTLPNWFVATYDVQATGSTGDTASTSFTDSNVFVSAVKSGTNTNLAVGIGWTTFKKDLTCTGTPLNSSVAQTGSSPVKTSGVAQKTAMSLLAQGTTVSGGTIWAFASWSGSITSTANPVCVPGDTSNGTIKVVANYVDTGVASTKQGQSIDFPAIADVAYGVADFDPGATASSGLTVSYAATPSSVCTITATNLVHIVAPGVCTVTASQAGNASYLPASDVTHQFTVNGQALTVTATGSQTYGSSSPTFHGSMTAPTGVTLNDSNLSCTTVNSGTAIASTLTAGGAYTIDGTSCTGAALSGANAGNYTIAYAGGAFTVNKAGSTTTVTCPASAVYTGSALTPCSATVTGANLSLTPTPSYSNNVNVGTNTASASYIFAGDTNHTGSSDSKNFSITQKPIHVTVTGSQTYGDLSAGFIGTPTDAPDGVTISGSVSCTGLTGGGTITSTLTAGGSYTIDTTTCTSTLAPSNTNYSIVLVNGAFTVSKADSTTTVSCSPKTTVYTGSAQTLCSVVITGAGGLNDTSELPTYADNTNVGTASASYAYAGDTNHNGSNGSDTFSITQATLSVNATANGKTFGSSDPALGYTLSGFVGPTDNATNSSITGAGSCSRTSGETVAGSPYTITCVPNTLSALNYQFVTGSTANFDITKASSTTTVTCSVDTSVYTGGAQTPCTVEITGAGGLDDTSETPSYANNTNVGTATASYTYAGDANHDGSNGSDTFSITKATLTVDAIANTKVYGSTDPALGYTLSGFKGTTDTATNSSITGNAVCTRTSGEDVAGSPYTISCDPNTLSAPNYQFAAGATANFTITKADTTTTVTCSPKTTVYTGVAQTLCGVEVKGAGGLDDTSGTPSYTNNVNVGTATASYSYTGDPNHNGSNGSDTFSITKASSATTVTCSPKTTVYTGAAQTLCTVEITGAALDDKSQTPSYTGNVNVGTATGSYTFGGDSNHFGSNGSDTFSITPATLTVDANTATKVYGANDPALTYTLHGFVGTTDNATNSSIGGVGSCSRTAGETVASSPYTITCVPNTLSAPNYTFVTGSTANFTITKAVLCVKANDVSGVYSDPISYNGVTITGFAPGENASVLGGTLAYSVSTGTLNSDGTIAAAAGTYPGAITPSGYTSNNYSFVYKTGTLTVTQETATIVYTGDTYTATSGTTTAHMAASITEDADGHLGNKLGAQSIVFTVYGSNNAVAGTCTSTISVPNPYTGSGTAACNVPNVGQDVYSVIVHLVANGYYTALDGSGGFTVGAPGTGTTTGGGWVTDPTSYQRDNFGFTVKYLKNGSAQGNSLFIYRVHLNAGDATSSTGTPVPAGDYNWIIKSNAMNSMSSKCPSGSKIGCTSTFTGKSTVTAENRATGVQYSLGGGNQFQVDVTDNGEPGSASAPAPDTYALRVWNASGTVYQIGTPTGQVKLGGGNIQVSP